MADQGRIVKMWFRKAIEDLQAAEKPIKGFLAFNKIRFSKTHDLEILVNLISQVDANFANQLKPAT